MNDNGMVEASLIYAMLHKLIEQLLPLLLNEFYLFVTVDEIFTTGKRKVQS